MKPEEDHSLITLYRKLQQIYSQSLPDNMADNYLPKLHDCDLIGLQEAWHDYSLLKSLFALILMVKSVLEPGHVVKLDVHR